MRTFSKFLFSCLLVLLLGTNANAQCFEQCNDVSDKLQEIHVLAAQAQGTAQQVYTFASNGNQNQLFDRITRLSGEISDLAQANRELVTIPGLDRLSLHYVQPLKVEFETIEIIYLDLVSSSSNAGKAAGAAALRDALNAHKGTATDKRTGLCCRED